MEYIADNLYPSLYMFVPRIFATVNFIVFSGREIAWFRLLQIYNAAAAEQRESPVRGPAPAAAAAASKNKQQKSRAAKSLSR